MPRYGIIQDEKGFAGFSVVDSKNEGGEGSATPVIAVFPFGQNAAASEQSYRQAEALADLLNKQESAIDKLCAALNDIIQTAWSGPGGDADYAERMFKDIKNVAKNIIMEVNPAFPVTDKADRDD